MSRTNLADDTFGDISSFLAFRRNPDNTFPTQDETEGAQQIQLGYAGVPGDETMTDDREISCSEIESVVETWSGPETISEPESWGASEDSEIGQGANNNSSPAVVADKTTVYIKSIVDVENTSLKTDSSSCNDRYDDKNLADGFFEETNLIDEITGPLDNILPHENYNDEDHNQIDDNIDTADNNSVDGSIRDSVRSQSLWAFSMILHIIEIVNVIPKMREHFQQKKPDGDTFFSLAMHFSYGVFLVMNIWTSILKEQYLIKANNTILSFPSGRFSKWNAAKLVVVLFLFGTINIWFYVLLQAKLLSGFGTVDKYEIMDTLECIGKMSLTFSRECTTSDYLSFLNIVWGMIGLALCTHEILVKIAISLGILISCGTLLYETFDFDNTEARQAENQLAHVTQADLNKITNLAEDLSKFIGEILTAYLIMNATDSTIVLYHVFQGGTLVFISGIFSNGIIFIGMLVGSVATLRINWIADEISSRELTQPPTARPRTALVVDFFRDMASRKSTGIGFIGVFVINFKTSFSYIGAIGALIALRL